MTKNKMLGDKLVMLSEKHNDKMDKETKEGWS